MAPHSSTLAWKIPWTEEPGGLQSMGSLMVWHDWVTSLSLFTFMHWRRKWQPTPVFLLENPRDGGAWWAAVYGVAQSRTWPKQLSSSSSSIHVSIPPARWILNHRNTRKVPRCGVRCHRSLACFKALLDPEWPREEGRHGFKSCSSRQDLPGLGWINLCKFKNYFPPW